MKSAVAYLSGIRVCRILLLALVFTLPSLLDAQSFRGSIRGKVVDPSGGLVPNAKISAKNTGTGLTREVATNEEGTYVLAELPAGSYTVTATNSGGSTTASVSITVNDVPPSSLSYSTNPAVYTKGRAITANTPVTSRIPNVLPRLRSPRFRARRTQR